MVYQQAKSMPVHGRDHLAVKFRQNWMAKYPLDTCSNGGINLDDSLTSLNWLQNLNIMKITTPTPPPSPVPNMPNNNCGKNTKVNPNSVLNVSCAPPLNKLEFNLNLSPDLSPLTPTSVLGDSVDYKTNPYVKPPYSYATLICMGMQETKKSKITLSAIYNWITENFMYYRLAEPSWQNSIRHNLSLNKCFQKVPRRKDEPGKGGFWRINPEYTDMIDNGIFKKRRGSRDTCPTPPSKKMKREEDGLLSPCANKKNAKNSVDVHFVNHDDDDTLREDFNWTAILNQDIEIGGVRVKTEQLVDETEHDDSSQQYTALSPPTSDSSDDFGIEYLFSPDMSSDAPVDYVSQHPLDLSINGTGIKIPDWWAESFNLEDNRGILTVANDNNGNGLHTPNHSSPVHEVQHPWAETAEFGEAAFDVDNLFDIENIPSPAL